MPRSARKRSESDIYHVIARGTAKQLIFEDDTDRRRFLELLGSALDEGFEVLAYCLMGNHVHLLLRTALDILSAKCRRLLSSYASWFNLRHGRCGHLFQNRFMSEPVEDEGYLLSVLRYIHKNPEKASVGDAERYRWSSYTEYLGQPRLASTSLVMGILGSPEAFVSLHERDDNEPAVMDVTSTRMMVCDEEALHIARTIAGTETLEQLKGEDRGRRDLVLRELKAAGLGVRQIQRLTGISLGVISKA